MAEATYVGQDKLIEWLRDYGSNCYQNYTVSAYGVIGVRAISISVTPHRIWEYKVSDSRLDYNVMSALSWCCRDSEDKHFTNSFDIYEANTQKGSYIFYTDEAVTNMFQVYSGIYEEGHDPAQVGWKSPISFCQYEIKSEYDQQSDTENSGKPVISYIAMPVFTNAAVGKIWGQRVTAYLADPTDENLQSCISYLYAHALNPRWNDENWFGPPAEEEETGEDNPGGWGSFDDTSDPISLPNAPSIGVSNMGFVNVYKVSAGALAALGNDVFPTISAGADILQCLTAISDMIFNSRLIDYVIDAHIMPCDVPAQSAAEYVRVGGRTCSAQGNRVTSDYVDVDCGSINIKEYYANYLDYVSTRSKLFLPFIGYVDMRPEFWQNGDLNVYYRFDVIDGSFIVYIRSTSSKSKLSNSVIAQYGGSCSVHVPITGANYASMFASIVGNGATAAAAIAGGSLGAVAVGGLASSVFNLANQSPTIQSSNSYNATSSFLSMRTPYLMIERPKSQFSHGYPFERGLPLNVYKRIGEMSGFATFDNPNLTFVCSDEEMSEIKKLLETGVFL